MQSTTTTEPSSSITLATSVPSQQEDKRLKARSCCFTYHDYHLDGADTRFKEYAKETRYMVFGYEVAPETGRKHLQGYVAWENPRSLDKFQKDIGPKKFHYEITRGTPKEASDYCKKDGVFFEHGDLPKQGERVDWNRAIEDLNNGQDVVTVITQQPHLLPNIRAVERFKQLTSQSTHRDVKVIFLTGAPGTGKTRWAYDNYPDLYSKPEGQWWDGYTGQDTVLLDDYYGDIPYSQFLKVLDRYPLNLQIKGGFVPAKYTTIIITSNNTYKQWGYQTFKAIERRIHITKVFNEDNQESDEEVPTQGESDS